MMSGHVQLELRRETIASPVADELIGALNAELTERYPEEEATNYFRLHPEEVSDGRGAFFIAYLDGLPVGCGAVRRLDPELGEIKRMYVAPTARGRGVGRRILEALITEAFALRVKRLVLETGPRQPEALALYRAAGFYEIPLFGEYADANPEYSLCMAKDL